ncbi:hypothetical protein L7F22_007676 [Adiantum nelumboides]|nr:hypothetical protein [Adiantum nelumboides]
MSLHEALRDGLTQPEAMGNMAQHHLKPLGYTASPTSLRPPLNTGAGVGFVKLFSGDQFKSYASMANQLPPTFSIGMPHNHDQLCPIFTSEAPYNSFFNNLLHKESGIGIDNIHVVNDKDVGDSVINPLFMHDKKGNSIMYQGLNPSSIGEDFNSGKAGEFGSTPAAVIIPSYELESWYSQLQDRVIIELCHGSRPYLKSLRVSRMIFDTYEEKNLNADSSKDHANSFKLSSQEKATTLISSSSSDEKSEGISNTRLEESMVPEDYLFPAQLQAQDNKVKSKLLEDNGKSLDIYMTVAKEKRLPEPPSSNSKRKKEVSKDPTRLSVSLAKPTKTDVQHWCRSCHNCQVNGNKRLLYGPQQAVIANGPFKKWGIDAMGPLPRTANGKLYILVAIDYMTRWVEAQSVAKVNEKTVSKFVYTHICCRFGTPLEIVFDNGPGFRRGLLTEVCEELKISHRHSTPYYPQSNGLVKNTNGIIARIIRKMVESKPKHWDNFLDGAIWAYRTTYRDATQFTPFYLVYGQEALQPIELNIPTIKLAGRQEQNNDEAWIDRLLNLVELEWKREAAYHCYKKKALQLKDKLNEGIKDKEIKEKSLVLRYNNALDNRFDAKFERRWEGPFIVKKAFTGGYYQLMDLNGKEHPRKVNGYRLKPYLSCILPAAFETKQVSKKTKKVCCHCCSGTHQVKSCAFQHVLHEVAKNQKENLSSPTSCRESRSS